MITENNKYQQLNWDKNSGLIPAIIQHFVSGEILMLGYMNETSIVETEKTGYVTFFSRSKQKIWTKGETSGNTLQFISWHADCDHDTLLIFAIPFNGTCHKNNNSCFHPAPLSNFSFLYQLEDIIAKKKILSFDNTTSSYTAQLYANGIKRIAQKVGEEGLETALAAVSCDNDELINEASDLIYHLLVLLQHKSLNFNMIINKLRFRNNSIKQIHHNL